MEKPIPHDSDDEDISAVRRVLSGDAEAFRSILKKYKDPVYSLAYRYANRDPDEAEDLSQEAFVHIYRKLPRFDLSRRFFPWMYTLALNIIRKRAKRKRLRTTELSDATPAQDETIDSAIDGAAFSRAALSVANELPEKYRAVFILRHFEERSYEEIAAVLSVPLGTVQGWLYRAREKFMTLARQRNIIPQAGVHNRGAKQ
ncbi:MAG: RNA polymerase sigma factor [Spirochaetota bacterium]